ncbi:hypothetical protein PG994_012962 [Apiospora phragmitis]|uniref:C2H2-type domain-containing protein n=1 Tax=Apiospora phragmitis TaxID=2905665 RepID=A0ABR1T7A6_9PEZI
MRRHVNSTHMGTVCQVTSCGHTTATEAELKEHLCMHVRSTPLPCQRRWRPPVHVRLDQLQPDVLAVQQRQRVL